MITFLNIIAARISIFYSLFFCLSPLFLASQQSIIDNEIKLIVEDVDLKNASISFYAFDAENNIPIAAFDENRALVPASTMKLLTTAAALEILGSKTQFKTSLFYQGEIDTVKRILYGNIIIKGGGDPAFASHRFQHRYEAIFQKWAAEIKKLGIDSINGNIITDATIFNNQLPSTWIWGDIGNYYGAAANGLSVFENFYTLSLKSAKEVGGNVEIKSITPQVPNLTFSNHLVSNAVGKDLAYIYGGPNQFNRLISGSIPNSKTDFKVKGSIPNTEILATYLLKKELNKIGVKTGFGADTIYAKDSLIYQKRSTEISQTLSPSVYELCKFTNLYSINLYAEHLLNHIGLKQNGEGGTISGSGALYSFWKNKGIDTDGMEIFDGSGLSRFNAITSKQIVEVLIYMQNSKNSEDYFNTLSIAGKSGTLSSIGKNTAAEGNVFGKSGYMNRVKSYAGYVKTKKGNTIAFAIIVNNYNCSATEMKIKLEKLMIKLSELD